MAKNIIEHLNWRYATKKFDKRKLLSEDKLKIIKDSFNLTATSYGLQPLKLVIISNNAIKEKLVPLTMGQPQVSEASHVLVLCIENELSEQYIKSHFKRIEKIRETPKAILAPFENFLIHSFEGKSGDEIKTWMEKQAYLAMGNLLTVCALEKIDACPIEGFEPKKYDELLGLDKIGLESVLVLAIGIRADDDLFAQLKKVRRGTSEVIVEID